MRLSDIKTSAVKVWNKLKAFVYSRSGDEWKSYFGGKLQSVRAFAQDQGEKAAALGFVLGILMVFFFKLIVISLVVIGLLVLTIIIAADSRPDDWRA